MYRLLPLFFLLSCDKPDPKTEQPPSQDDDGDGLSVEDGDCNDEDSSISPQATEVCDGIDQNCDGQADEGVLVTYYTDGDADGYGSGEVTACTAPSGSSSQGGDCDDSTPDISPAATEVCDGVDNNCNGQADDGATDAPTWYTDQDGDGFGDPDRSSSACTPPTQSVSENTDCDDQDSDIHPAATEVCDGVDNNCNGQADDGATDAPTWYTDQDGDGFGDPDRSSSACTPPAQSVSENTDCDDQNSDIHPAAAESCDGVDNNCDGSTDGSDAVDGTFWYLDADGDQYGDPNSGFYTCTAPTGYVVDNTDCGDADAAVYPGAPERCHGIDQDCSGAIDDASVPLCDDGNACTLDSCDGANGCSATVDSSLCPLTTYSSQTDFEARTCGNFTVLSFQGGTELNGVAVNDVSIVPSYASQGVNFLPYGTSAVYPYVSRGQQGQIALPNHDGLIANNNSPYPTSDLDGRAIKGEFVNTTYSVGLWTNMGDGGHLDAYDVHGTLIGSANVSSGGFGGIVSPVPIASFTMVCTFDGDINFGIYDLQFSDCIQ